VVARSEHYWTRTRAARNNFHVESDALVDALVAVGSGASAVVPTAFEARLCAVCVALCVGIAFLPSVPSAAIALARARSRLAFARRVAGGQVPSPARGGLRAWLGAELPVTTAWLLIAHIAPSGKLGVDVLAPYVAFAAMGAAAGLVTGPTGLLDRVRAAGAYFVVAAAIGIVIATACALAGTRSLAALVDAQGAWPWQWALFQRPALFAGFVLYLGCAGRMLVLPERAGVLVQAVQPIGQIVVCGLGASVFLGGWRVPVLGALDPDTIASLGAVAFVAKAWLIAALADAAYRATDGRRARVPAVMPAMLAMLALASIAIARPPGAVLETCVGYVVCASVAIVFAHAVVTVMRSSRPMGEGPTHPAPFA
jgi:hypothetical protein